MSFCARLSVLAWSWEKAKSHEPLNPEVGMCVSQGLCRGCGEKDDKDDENDCGDGEVRTDDEDEEVVTDDEDEEVVTDDEGDGETEDDEYNAAQVLGREHENVLRIMVARRFREEFGDLVEATKDGLDYPMSEWMAQHAYGKAISDNSLHHGHMYWSKSGTVIFHDGEPFDVVEYRGFTSSIPGNIGGLKDKMTFFSKIPPIPLHRVFDNTANYTNGYGICTEPRNSEWQDFCLLSHILKTPELREIFYPNGSDTLCRVAMSEYLKSDLEIQHWFAAAILLTSGAPPRGTEILALLKYNTATSRRNIFVVDGDVMILSAYNKKQGVVGHTAPIYRFLPKAIGEQLVQYLFYIEPLADLFHHRLTKGNSNPKDGEAPSPLLFTPYQDDSRPWDPSMISKFLKRESKLAFNFPLQLSNYRQIIAAIARSYIEEMSEIIDGLLEQKKSKVVEQFGHCYRTNVAHYGVTSSRVPETEEISMKKFRRATMYYQFFLGVIPALPEWMFQLPIELYPQSNCTATSHPVFRHAAFPRDFVEAEAEPVLSPRRRVITPHIADSEHRSENQNAGVHFASSFAIII
ncbi:hypothetical protein TWF506_009414 [Arthrobotrys conoides]|uniref:Uncharacterized protein n=1 Tax=Arthrobotrys conoides TaxID=74498 RepID=A0AAN8RX18_9PEZI